MDSSNEDEKRMFLYVIALGASKLKICDGKSYSSTMQKKSMESVYDV